jgi:Domain of unknown function (DUF4129)
MQKASLNMLCRVCIFALAFALVSSTVVVRPLLGTSRVDVELDLSAYIVELDRCAESVRQGQNLAQLRESLPNNWIVQTEQSRVVVPTDWLASQLLRAEHDSGQSKTVLREVRRRLAAMRQSATDMERASPQAGPQSAHTQLDKILQRREFAGADGPSQSELWAERIGRWITERILRLFSLLHVGRTTGNVITWAIVALALGFFCYWVWKNIFRARRSEPAQTRESATEELRQWARDAFAAADRGDYREAVHCAYWATIVHLESLGLLRRDHSRTPRESLRLLEPHPKERQLVGDFTRHFELIWYGYRPASPDDWTNARTHLEKMGCLTASTPATANS